MRLALFAAVAATLSALALSCQVLLGIEDHDFKVDVPDASHDAADAKATVSCSAPLPAKHDGGGEEHTYAFALRTVALGGEGQLGFDLDLACTCSQVPGAENRQSCEPPDAAVRGQECDQDGGVDNGLLPLVTGFTKDAVTRVNAGIAKEFAFGRQNLVFILQEYNGLPDDERVLLQAIPSFGIREPRADDPDASACSPTCPAVFDGADRWSVDDSLVSAGGAPVRPSFAGYVSGGRLVVDGRLPSQPADSFAVVGLGTPPVGLRNPVFVANVEIADGGLAVTDGVMAGRANVGEALRSFGELVQDDATGARACNDVGWPILQQAICRSVDLMTDSHQDFTSTKCDAIPFVVRFSASPALVVPAAPPPPVDVDAAACAAGALTCD